VTLCNIIFAWDSLLLITSKQQTGHSLHDVLQILRQLSTGCDDNRAATAKVHVTKHIVMLSFPVYRQFPFDSDY